LKKSQSNVAPALLRTSALAIYKKTWNNVYSVYLTAKILQESAFNQTKQPILNSIKACNLSYFFAVFTMQIRFVEFLNSFEK
jgi:hypothetical protein